MFQKVHEISYYIGIAIIFLSHIYLLFNAIKMKNGMTFWQVISHSIINIIACVLIAYYFMYNEGYIEF